MITRRRLGRTLAVLLALTTAGLTTGAAAGAMPTTHHPHPGAAFGANVTVFDPGMPTSEIQDVLDTTWAAQVNNEMGTQRYAYYFKPGTYGTAEEPLQI